MKELPLSKAYQFIEPGPVVLVATSDHGQPNLMAMSYHMVIADGDKPLIGCMLGPWDQSFKTLLSTGECVLAVPTVDLASKVVGIGNCSGTDTDKFKSFGLTSVTAEKVKAPLVAECLVNLECRIADDGLIDKYNLIILEVVKAWINPDREECRLIHHNGNGTFTVDGETMDLRDKMVRWSSYVQR
ncbi:flavin reductase family protein [Paenibacillus apii]|uniref:flavin reductase family protein n=1 Tax=Paenibacillus apii TaxID=1850370 RepID=UPI00143AA720|nr:flavin reductase family protein [Paenibacillus apii]NJJ38234.1 flavin reductase family protein [Paenibacillus apii]